MRNIILKLLFFTNYILIILFMSCHSHINGEVANIESIIPLLISSLMLIDITYISSCNIRESKVISLFCGLLALDSWYILLLSFDGNMIEDYIFAALSPIIWFVSIRFILMFLFQGSGYKFRKVTNMILLVTCISSLIGINMPSWAYASLFGIQFLASCLCFIFIIIYHWKRVSFVLKSECINILFSAAVITVSFTIYYLATIEVQNHISNFGIYLPALLLFISIHGIVLSKHSSYPLSTVFSRTQIALITCLSITMLETIVLITGGNYLEMFIAVNVLFAFIYICNIILGYNLKQGKSKIIRESKYNTALQQLQKEELLKTEFANFLHDDVLQDLLSVKNMMTKSHRPEIQKIIIETLDNLNIHIRKQMQDYHPVILKNLTAKENYQNLIEAVAQSFPQRNIRLSFDCPDNLFLVKPYSLLIYRLLKELLTNVYKHSDGNQVWIKLTLKNNIIKLFVNDNGTAKADCLTSADKAKHKGIASIAEQLKSIQGSMVISDNLPHGIYIQITIPMKGDIAYEYFVN